MKLHEFEDLTREIQSVGLLCSASEWHGFVCGALSFDLAYSLDASLQSLAEESMDQSVVLTSTEELQKIYENVRNQLIDPTLQFELCLPDSERFDLNSRVIELKVWCEGFLYGLVEGGLKPSTSLSSDTQEIMQDFSRITQLGMDHIEGEENEVAYNELVEFVRMAALLLAEELQPIQDLQGSH